MANEEQTHADDPPAHRRRTLGAGVIEPEFAPKTGEALAEIDPEHGERTPLPHAPDAPPDEAPPAVVTSLEDDAPDGPLNPPREEPKRCAFRVRFDEMMSTIDGAPDLETQAEQTDETLRVAFALYFSREWSRAFGVVRSAFPDGPTPSTAAILFVLLEPVRVHIKSALQAFDASHGVNERPTRLVLDHSGRFFLEAGAYVQGLSNHDHFRVRVPAGSVDGPRGQIIVLEEAAREAATQLVRDIRAKLFEGYT